MRRAFAVAVLLLTVAACSPGTEAATTRSTTTPGTTGVTTTTTASTTTMLPTSTTTMLEGNWADQPVIATPIADLVLGWWDGSAWVQAEKDTSLPVEGGEDYQIALLEADGLMTTGGPQEAGCDIVDPSGFPGVELADPDLLLRPLHEGEDPVSGLAISAPWELTPHHVGEGEAHPDLEAIAVELLSDRGFATTSADIVQTVDADLDGDGAIETLVVAEETRLGNEMSEVYSLVFGVSPNWHEPRVVDESVIPASESGFPASFRISAIADLSGDGVMEVVIDGEAWENAWNTVYELTSDAIVARISAGCGV